MAASSRAFSMPATVHVIDAHLHVWATSSESFLRYPYDQPPPRTIQDIASPEALLEYMKEAGVDGALIVQPINHKFDHTYVSDAIAKYPTKFKGMLLHDPSLPPEFALERLEQLILSGFVGVRFNPYLWEDGKLLSDESSGGLEVYKRCAELQVPVGIMCFKGLNLHIDDILALISKSPETKLILDHIGFCALNEEGDRAFDALLNLARHPNVYVKISAMFRNTGDVDSYPYEMIREKRFIPLLRSYGVERLMMGSDFPYVLETEGSYKGAIETVKSWLAPGKELEEVMGGTAQRLFGSWIEN
jgi:predicted TIM-barrel fold metal-dependent hydrolase